MDFGLVGKSALVLGSSRGIGYSTARMLASEGCHVVLNGRADDLLRQAVARLLNDFPAAQVSYVVCDLSSRSEVSRLADRVKAQEISCDILVNNTGGPPVRSLGSTSLEDWQTAFSQMALPIFEITNAAVPQMAARKWGRVINVVSSGVHQPILDLGISNTLRSGIVAWSKTLSNEVAHLGITSNCVIPGRIKTQRLLAVDAIKAAQQGVQLADIERQSCETIALGRYGEPDEMARAISFLASEGSAYITGTTLRVDGGLIKAT